MKNIRSGKDFYNKDASTKIENGLYIHTIGKW